MRDDGMTMRLMDALYVEAMALADETRDYFDGRGRIDREALSPFARIVFTCESMKVTTRLMHVIAWLLTRRALAVGEIGPREAREAREPSRRLGRVGSSPVADLAILPEAACLLAHASDDLYGRIGRLDAALARPASSAGPARGLIARLESAF